MLVGQHPTHLDVSDLFLQLLTVNEPRSGVGEAARGVGVEVTGSEDGLRVLELPRLGGDVLEQSWKTGRGRLSLATTKSMLTLSGLFY